MKNPLTVRGTFSMFAVVITFVAILLWYGCWSREAVDAPTDVAKPLTGKSFAVLPGPCVLNPEFELGPEDVFADNFDAIPGEDMDEVIEHLIRVENPSRNVHAVGDRHLRNKAYGLLQIRKPYLDDVNKIAGTKYTIKDMKDPVLARWAAKVYLNHYGNIYLRKTGEVPTLEVYARIHNGGPNGWKKASTNDYIRKLNGGLK